jgi:hypothetical protein
MTVANLFTWLRICILAWLHLENWSSPSPLTIRPRLLDTVDHKISSAKTGNGPANGRPPPAQSANGNTNSSNRTLHASTGLATASQGTRARPDHHSSSFATHAQTNSTNINMPEDFILLCIKVKRFLTTRHDLRVSAITRDRELFEAFRREYHSKFRWAYRQFSFRTVQRVNFVKVRRKIQKLKEALFPSSPSCVVYSSSPLRSRWAGLRHATRNRQALHLRPSQTRPYTSIGQRLSYASVQLAQGLFPRRHLS